MENRKNLNLLRKGWTGDKLQVIIDEWGQNPQADEIQLDESEVADPEEIVNES